MLITSKNPPHAVLMKDFFFWFPTVFPQGFQPETNHYSCRVGPQNDKALAQEILFKVQVARLEPGSSSSRVQYKHFETKSPTNLVNPLGLCLWKIITITRLLLLLHDQELKKLKIITITQA